MRLLRAEMRKLRRPLPLAMIASAFVLCAIIARQQVVTDGAHTPAGLSAARLMENPIGIGKLAAGEMASLLGAVVMLFLAGAHVAGEWSGHTMKTVLAVEPRRWRILLVKFVSLWLTGVAVLIALWCALGAWSLILTRWWPVPGSLGADQAMREAGPDLLRAVLVIAAFAALGVCMAILTRSTLGTVIAGVVLVGVSMEAGNIDSLARYSPSYWVDGWMQFHPPGSGVSTYAMWNTGVPGNVPVPTVAIGAVGLGVILVLAATVSWARFRRMDITG